MPIYEYEHIWDTCLDGSERVDVLQRPSEPALKYCPYCGLEVRRLVGRPAVHVSGAPKLRKAGQKGFTTFRRAEQGVWERVDGDGVDAIVATDEQKAELASEGKVLNLDALPNGS